MMGVSSKSAGGVENKKKYNGIEFDSDLGINTYEAFYRNLDVQIGRWWQVDPKTENQETESPYSSMANDPVLKSDPLGDEPDYGSEDPPTKQAAAFGILVLEGSGGTAIGALIAELTPIGLGLYALYEYGQFVARHPNVAEAAGKGSTPFSAQVATEKYINSIRSQEQAINNGATMVIGFVKKVQATVKAQGQQKGTRTNGTQQNNQGPNSTNKPSSALPKPPKGKGSVAPNQRDPKRVFTKKEKSEMLENQNGTCVGCGQQKNVNEVHGHHVKRHADGGKTEKSNGAAVCKDCHTEIHQ